MPQAKSTRQIKTVEVDRGLYVVRYVSAEDEAEPPTVTIGIEASGAAAGNLILHPDALEPVLWKPGAALVLRATDLVTMTVEVNSSHAEGSTAANVRIERISPDEGPSTAEPAALDVSDLRLLAHVAGLGDVEVEADQWIAGPSAPSRIEGISLTWPSKPRQFEIRYSVKAPQAGQSRMVELGAFAGTRGQALPLIGVVFELSGPATNAYQFVVDAVFLGSPNMRVAGKRVVLFGPTGREPLVGLRVRLEKSEDSAAMAQPKAPVAVPARTMTPQTTPKSPVSATDGSVKPSSGVRVFTRRDREGRRRRAIGRSSAHHATAAHRSLR